MVRIWGSPGEENVVRIWGSPEKDEGHGQCMMGVPREEGCGKNLEFPGEGASPGGWRAWDRGCDSGTRSYPAPWLSWAFAFLPRGLTHRTTEDRGSWGPSRELLHLSSDSESWTTSHLPTSLACSGHRHAAGPSGKRLPPPLRPASGGPGCRACPDPAQPPSDGCPGCPETGVGSVCESDNPEPCSAPVPLGEGLVVVWEPTVSGAERGSEPRGGKVGRTGQEPGSYQLLAPGAAGPRLDAVPAAVDLVLGALLGEDWGEMRQAL